MDWEPVLRNLCRLLIAYLLAVPIGWNRYKSEHGLSFRTFPLVAIASCGYVLVGEAVLAENVEAQSRILQGLMAGIGFIGAGAIMKRGGSVHGTATAASIWNTGTLGAAVAYSRYEIAIILSIINFLTLLFLKPSRNEPDANN